jgi:phosphoglycerate dehydrogenase-like enzyme
MEREPSLKGLRIVVTDRIISRFEDQLKHDGGTHRWDMAAAWTPDRQLDALAGADVVVCSSLSRQQAGAAARLKLVHVTGAGYDKFPFRGCLRRPLLPTRSTTRGLLPNTS